MANYRTSDQLGFTLVELVLVLVVASIVAISVSSKFFRADDASLYSASDTTLALLHQVQLISMQDTANLTTRCPTLVFSSSAIGVATNAPCSATASFVVNPADPEQILLDDLQLQVSQQGSELTLPVLIRFDHWGRPQGHCGNGCTINLAHTVGQKQICLSSEGYISSC
jgi:MSHA pilin protein MshC